MKHFQLKINEQNYSVYTREDKSLLRVLREDLQLTGTKCGCDSGVCGACKVLINGTAKQSCKIAVSDLNDAHVTTIEGVANSQELHPIQEAFIQAGAVQCGYCTPAMVISAKALLDTNLNPTDDEIKKAINGNLCRCTGYVKIINAVKAASKLMQEGK